MKEHMDVCVHEPAQMDHVYMYVICVNIISYVNMI